MSLTEKDMNALREMTREIVADECGKAAQASDDRTGARLVELEKGLRSEMGELRGDVRTLTGRVDGIAADLAVVKASVSSLKADMVEVKDALELLTSKRLARIESRLDALEERGAQHGS